MMHLQHIFENLGLTKQNGLCITSELDWRTKVPNRISRLLVEVINPDAFFCIENKPLLLFFKNSQNKKNKLQQIWNFNESPVVIFVDEDAVEIYNGFDYLSNLSKLSPIGNKTTLLNTFNYFQLVTGKTWESYVSSAPNRVDSYLLENIKTARKCLIDKGLSSEITNALIGKIIFIRYLIDRKVKLNYKGESKFWSNDEFCETLANKKEIVLFFDYLKNKFNGDLFPINSNVLTEEHLNILIQLLQGQNIKTGQVSLFNLYDFSIIPIEFISNVYEFFIGQKEQEETSAYYTPLFLVDYILAETIDKFFSLNPNSYTCKVLDPACGSGIFLVESLRKIIAQYKKNNPTFLDNPVDYQSQLKKIAEENIYGIDKNESAVNIAIFSIYLTLLDYQTPSDIETFRFPSLLDKNFFVADFFDTKASYNEQFKSLPFDIILGNPPWKRGDGKEKALFVEYTNTRKKVEKNTTSDAPELLISNKEIAQAFLVRVSDFSTPSTNVAFIVTSKILYNLNAKNFRKYFLHNYAVSKVFELASVRKEVFSKSNDSAIAPPCILFYKYAHKNNTDNQIIEHITLKPNRFFSLFKIFTIQRNDYKRVQQVQLKEYDYLWKVLVYGTYLDFNLINRLKSDYPTIKSIISDETRFLIGQGIMVGGGDIYDASALVGKPYIDTKKDIKPFLINENLGTWDTRRVHRIRNKKLYEGPLLLITGGCTSKYEAVAAISNKDAVFKSSLTAIKSLGKDDLKILQQISGLLNSAFFAYINLCTFSSSGIEREEVHDEEKFSLPFSNSNAKIPLLVSEIEQLKKQGGQDIFSDYNSKIEKKIIKLNKLVLTEFSFSPLETSLLDYATDITIPLITRSKGHENIFKPLIYGHDILAEYVQLFIDRFQPAYLKANKKIVVEIKHTNYLVGMFFKIIENSSNDLAIQWTKSQDDTVLQFVIKISSQKITERLFIQKDVRGFEKNGFYIIKPNEAKLWHKAIAYLDLNEFVDAILQTGRKQDANVLQ